MTAHDLQAELGLTRRPESIAIPVEMIRAKKTSGAAFCLACDASGLDDKEIHMALELDPATFSRIKSGKNTLAADQIARFCTVVGNRIYAEWIAYQLGCTLVMIKSEAEKRAENAENELMVLRRVMAQMVGRSV